MSFDIALSGIQAINEQLDTISNNIANAGTYGFKSSRANFSAMYAGTTPVGTQVTSTTQSIGLNGGVLNTGRATDASINGRGFFVLKDNSGQTVYSRVGLFTKNADDFLVDANGRKVQGFPIAPGATTQGPLGDLKVPTGLIPAKPTTDMKYVANLSLDWTIPDPTLWTPPTTTTTPPTVPDVDDYNMTKTTLVYDSRGTEHTITQYFVKVDADTVQVHIAFDGEEVTTPATPPTLEFDATGKLIDVAPAITSFTPGDGNTPPGLPIAGADPLLFTIDWRGTTFQAGDAVTSTNKADGYSSGNYVGVELQDDGSVIAKYSNGERQRVGVIGIATFPNEDALTQADNTSWTANTAAGDVNVENPGIGLAGTLSAQTLEGSNVDITSELVGLMTSQRNYQANSKVITTENQMLQSLMQAM
ncbi:flagellar hook protein FlgE [Pseudoduganella rhizocola]|uniref:flagellar hook protein FlgE n=1 Tax=Pseudoduganella rhizocola TaxID=3382643 RepID=UPI0038B4AA00